MDDEDPGIDRVKWIGEERLRAVTEWMAERLRENRKFKALIWCRFRAEAERLHAALLDPAAPFETKSLLLIGGQGDAEREEALALLRRTTSPDESCALVGTIRTGGMGLDMSAADALAHGSHDYSRLRRTQADARIVHPARGRPCYYYDFVAEGPRGESTIDHVVLRALKHKRDLAALTASEWLKELSH